MQTIQEGSLPKRFIYPLNHQRLPRNSGEKIKNLHYLFKKGFSIPPTHAISWDLQRAFYQNDRQFPDSFRKELELVLDSRKTYAIRSSGNVEDAQSQSYAGQFLSVLEVRGLDNVLDAIRAVWDSSHLDAPRTYQSHQRVEQVEIKMGVVLQEMIPARFSGVAFSCNPITGMDEIVIEAVEGSGVTLLQDGITPFRWIWKWGKWLQQPEKSDLPQQSIQEIALSVREISSSCGYPVDVEWVFDGQRVIWLQMRAITTLKSIDIYANHIPKEVFPGLIKPLVWTVIVPLVNGAWVKLLTELIGENQLDPLRLAKSFYGYAYFNMGLLGTVFQKIGLAANALERLMGFEAEGDNGPSFRPSIKAIRHIPRVIKFSIEKARFDRKFESFFTQAEKEYAELETQDLKDLTNSDLVAHISKLNLLNQQTVYFNIVTPLLMRFYHFFAKRKLARTGINYEGINWLEGWNERADYDPVFHLRDLGAIYNSLDTFERQAALTPNPAENSKKLGTFKKQQEAFLKRFGHMSDSGTDFSFPLWEETPGVVLNLIAGLSNSPSSEKSERLSKSASHLASREYFVKRAIRYSRYREQISFLFTRGVSMFRSAYVRIGENFCEHGLLGNAEDIFFLEHEEILSAIRQGEAASSLQNLTQKRKNDYVRYQSITLPPVIYGDHLPTIVDKTSASLTGIPTSRGLYRGVVRVVKGIGDFPKVTAGCVLVIPYSDVSWTPLFAIAGALIAESGGMLSHSSIIAREYGIPAIVSVPHATQLLDGIEVTVDGYTGNIILHEP